MPLAILILVLASVWRVVTLHFLALSNFSPVMALAFCSGVYTRNRWQWLAPFAAIVLTDLYINHYYEVTYRYEWTVRGEMLNILCFGAALGIGIAVSRRRNWLNLMGGALAGSFIFYLVTNTASWAGDVAYARSAAGWWQALTVGHPEYYPTIFFFRNTLASDLMFTALFAVVMEYHLLRKGSPSLLGLKQVGR